MKTRAAHCLFFVHIALGLAGCAQTGPTPSANGVAPPNSSTARACARNFKVEGSALAMSGKKVQTRVIVAGVDRSEAMNRASRKIAQEGLKITTIDRQAGLITASNRVIGGRGSQDDAQLVATFENTASGLAVTLRFTTSFGQTASEDGMRDNLCSVIAAIEGRG